MPNCALQLCIVSSRFRWNLPRICRLGEMRGTGADCCWTDSLSSFRSISALLRSRLRFRMLPVVDVLSFLLVTGDTWPENGLGLPDKLPACPVLVEAGEAVLLSRKFTGTEVAGRGLRVLLHIGARLHGGVCTHGGVWHVGQGDPVACAPTQRQLAHQDLGRRCHVKPELDLLLFVHLGGTCTGVGGVKQHSVLALGCVGCPEWRVIKNPELLADVLHINLHLLHCTVEDAFSLFHKKRNFFRHEVTIIYWNLGSNVLSRETGIHLPIFIPQSFCRPEWKPLQFCPNQRMRIATRLTKPVISFLAGS